jgi:hypothetical protein
MAYTDSVEEVCEVRAASHAYVLTGINQLPRDGIGERACPPAEPLAGFQHSHAEAARGKCDRTSKTRKSATNHHDAPALTLRPPLPTSVGEFKAYSSVWRGGWGARTNWHYFLGFGRSVISTISQNVLSIPGENVARSSVIRSTLARMYWSFFTRSAMIFGWTIM